ncbi:MAG: hypothetical protein K8R68_12485 [Bacteroidales bacterium]|nr:hypothetical protein [Bacteroidales bacterium]
MKSKHIDFLKKLMIFTIILAFAGYFITIFLPDDYISPTIPFLYLFFVSSTAIVHHVLLKISSEKPTGFTNYFMLLTFGKLIFFLTIILVYSLLNRDDAPQFIITFFILYVFYTVFEVVISLSHSKTKK